jgi:hypothetical protein
MRDCRFRFPMWLAPIGLAVTVAHAAASGGFTMSQVLDYPDDGELAAAKQADVIAWVRTLDGIRNIWVARGPGFNPVRVTNYRDDDGQEITQLTFSPDGSRLVYVRGATTMPTGPPKGTSPPIPTRRHSSRKSPSGLPRSPAASR